MKALFFLVHAAVPVVSATMADECLLCDMTQYYMFEFGCSGVDGGG